MNVYFLGPFANDRNNSCGNSDGEVISIKIMMMMAIMMIMRTNTIKRGKKQEHEMKLLWAIQDLGF